MYDPVEMMEVLAMCIALAGVVYLSQLFASVRTCAQPKPALTYTIYGDLILPVDFYDWVHVQLTDESVCNPIDSDVLMTYPDVYIAPAAYKYFLSARTLPDGIIAFKRISGRPPIPTSGLADRSCRSYSEASDTARTNVATKDALRFGEDRSWGFFRLDAAECDDL